MQSILTPHRLRTDIIWGFVREGSNSAYNYIWRLPWKKEKSAFNSNISKRTFDYTYNNQTDVSRRLFSPNTCIFIW